MNLWDFIKSKIFGKKIALPEANVAVSAETSGISANNFDKNVKVSYTPQLEKEAYMPQADTIEFALQQYLYGVMKQHNDGRSFNSYSVLTGICGMDTSNPGRNAENELSFIKRLINDNKVLLTDQPSANGGVCFRHIQNGRDASNTDRRLYVNCKRENIAELAGRFYEEFGDNPYYFKFCTDEQASSKRRSEQFVFYVPSEPHELNNVIQTIQRTKQKYPNLFAGSKNMNPFMRDVDGFIGYAPDVKDGIYHSMNGEAIPIAKSYNTLLSEALTDSFTYAIRDVVAQDYGLSCKVQGQVYDRAYPYIRDSLGDVLKNPELQKKLIEKMKQNLEKCTQKNSILSIKGLEQDRSR